jgi:PTS system arbutin-like IIC component
LALASRPAAGSAEGIATIAGIRTLDMGIAGALLISGVVIALHNRFFDTRLPEWLGVFSGSTFVYMVCVSS